ncbi:laccase domain protein YlmD [Paenibacillus marchantiophytorum]|uniref:Purine nucleoside phosphorylase n=1 Tax=Paenibacillus marchantiophytorum TaxID=1619310 RepID=A0ABQ2BMP7_9BACL|nr:peptidoglycan editing factor PgeF [Paenibacillus marchantiophytorum]GGI43303.1 laccase domain protein YlmD [Paenibacillus marchantiophytorum]
MEPFVKQEKSNRPVLFIIESWMEQFNELTVGFTSRHGGVSLEPFTTLNCGLHVNDVPEHVVRNRELVAEALEQPFEAFTYAEQVHGNEVVIVSLEERGSGRASREAALQAKDGFITKETGIVLCAQFADCVPLFFYDPIKRVVGLAHAGWKGTVLNISKATIDLMTHTFGSSASDIRTAIGPSIGACCYEVDQSVANRAKAVLEEVQAAPVEHSTVMVAKENGKYMLNLQELNRILLQQAGILSSYIEVSQLCTSCNTDKFFSHRKEGGATGRMIAWIGLT